MSEQALAQHIGHVLVGRPGAVPCQGIIQGALGVEVPGQHLEHKLVGGIALVTAGVAGGGDILCGGFSGGAAAEPVCLAEDELMA